MLATTAMHAYGHQWSCQLIYNPRLKKGLGLTDGEGVERIWSRLRGLIGMERRSGVSFLFTNRVISGLMSSVTAEYGFLTASYPLPVGNIETTSGTGSNDDFGRVWSASWRWPSLHS